MKLSITPDVHGNKSLVIRESSYSRTSRRQKLVIPPDAAPTAGILDTEVDYRLRAEQKLI